MVRTARAEDEVRPAVVRIDLYARDGQLTGDITAHGLFSERIVGTVQSGLPAVVEVFYLVAEPGGGTVEKGVHSYSLKYDIWDDTYSVTGQDSTVFLPSLEAMRSMIEQMTGLALVPLGRMHAGRSHYVQLSIAVSPLRGSDKRRMTGWISENVRSTGEASWHEQVLDVNDLITHFFSREKDTAKTTDWFRSPPFKPELLPSRDTEER
ncbi:MAG: hypothetical protein ABIJ00_11105 [Candidatus Eisenbacteria bacterium]